MTVAGRDGWLFLDRELRHLAAGPFWGESAAAAHPKAKPGAADPLAAIVDFHEQLARAGIELILMPVPPKAVIYPEQLDERFAGDGPRLDVRLIEFYELLAKTGVHVFDLTPVFLQHKSDDELAPLYCRQDSHWSGGGCVLAASEIAQHIANAPWRSDLARQKEYVTRTENVPVTGDLAKALNSKAPSESIPLRFVSAAGDATSRPVADDPHSPIVLLGDSHNLVFHAGGEDMHAAGAGLADQLAFELGIPIDVVAVRGSGATPARVNLLRNARRQGYIENKKLVIWCFAAREFTEADGWPKVPVIK